MGSDGSGVVRAGVGLDREALEQSGGFRGLDDLRRAGYRIIGPRRERDGLTWLRAEKAFSKPADANQAMARLNAGPFQRFRVRRRHTLLRTTTKFSGTVDLTGGAQNFVEGELRQRLQGADLGLDAGDLQRRTGLVLNRIFRVQVATKLPGKVSSNAPTEADEGVVWRPKLGERAVLEASAKSWNKRTIRFGLLAILAAGAAVLLVLRRRRP
jgi:hypothetical protein